VSFPATRAESVTTTTHTSSDRPRSCPWALSVAEEQRILDARARTNWGPMRLTWLTGRHRSTIWKVPARHGVSRQRRTERPQTTRRYEWTEAGALLHIDAFELPKFDVPGHRAHGDRAGRHRTRRAGKVKVIGVIDDHTRLAYCELHAAENAATVSATLRRAAAWMAEQGCGPLRAVIERQRPLLLDQPPVPRHAHRARRPAHPHPSAHPALETARSVSQDHWAVRGGGEAPRACRSDSGKGMPEIEISSAPARRRERFSWPAFDLSTGGLRAGRRR
jgi:hypothetical protein